MGDDVLTTEDRMNAVRAELDRLAALTPDQIAADLLAGEDYGERGCANNCPMANHLGRLCGGGLPEDTVLDVAVDGLWVNTRLYAGGRKLAVRSYDAPESVSEFVRRFDADAYPALDLDPPGDDEEEDEDP